MTSRYAAEFVFPGHPDKLCDAIADALVEAAIKREQRALCGVEVAIHRCKVFITGRIACEGAKEIDITGAVGDVFATAGYNEDWYPAPKQLKIETDLCLGPLLEGESEFREVSDDQSIVTGFAIDEPGSNYLPVEHWLANRVGRALYDLRISRPDLGLGPDGKVLVTTEESDNLIRVTSFSASLQQRQDGPVVELHRAVLGVLEQQLATEAKAIAKLSADIPTDVCVNGAGSFSVGGPEGDNGLSGKKLVVDAYGPRIPIGGGALSGKDFYKADRAGAIMARRLAKAIVVTGGSAQCCTTLAFSRGEEEPRLLSARDAEGRELNAAGWLRLLDSTLRSCGDNYSSSDRLAEVARYGHFVQSDLPWEVLRLT